VVQSGLHGTLITALASLLPRMKGLAGQQGAWRCLFNFISLYFTRMGLQAAACWRAALSEADHNLVLNAGQALVGTICCCKHIKTDIYYRFTATTHALHTAPSTGVVSGHSRRTHVHGTAAEAGVMYDS
jgi:hypothetical protein